MTNIIEARRATIERVESISAQEMIVGGHVLTQGAGEVLVRVDFPVIFSEKPIFTFGGELDRDFVPVESSFPTVSAIVAAWVRSGATEGFDGYYSGADLVLVTTGVPDQQIWVHWLMQAVALQNPVNAAAAVVDAYGEDI